MQKTTHFGEAELDDLNRMMPDITAHLKALSANLNPLIAEPVRTMAQQMAFLKTAKRHFFAGHRLQFYPVRKAVTAGDRGVNVIRPQAMLPSPVSDTVLPLETEKAS